jgi:hypothetical protein
MSEVEFNGEYYRDDRMYVLYVCKCTEDVQRDHVATTIYHEEPPPNSKWCLVTYKNVERYMAVRVDTFDSKQDVETYMSSLEPTVPLVSLGGRSRNPPLSYEEFARWKSEQGFEEYDYKKMYMPGGENPRETIICKR